MALPIAQIRRQFPFLAPSDGNTPIYLDSAATTLKPIPMLEALQRFYEHDVANVHRGVHKLAEQATERYEDARKTVQHFLSARFVDEIIFTSSTTASINLVAHTFGRNLRKGDAVLLSTLEHHSNIVPWLQLQEEKGIDVRWVDCDSEGQIDIEDYARELKDPAIKLVAITGQSNVTGTRPPLREIISLAHKTSAKVLVDASQLIAHTPVDVEALDCDMLAFSGHKIFGPTGIGVLYGKRKLLRDLPPFLGGGMMIKEVTKDSFIPADPPQRFEAGTMPAAEAVALAAAIEWASAFSWEDRREHEEQLLARALGGLRSISGVHIIGPSDPKKRSGVIAFTIDGIHPHDLSDLLGERGIFLRAGHHCAEPLHKHLGIKASLRLSVTLYNTEEEIDRCIATIKEIQQQLSAH